MKQIFSLLLVAGVLATGCKRQEPPAPVPPPEDSLSQPVPTPLPPLSPSAPPPLPPAGTPPAPTAVPFTTLEDYIALEEAQRLAAVSAVATRGPKEAAEKLAEIFRVESSTQVKTAILDELGFMENTAALKPVLATFDTNQPEEVQQSAIEAAETLLSDLADSEDPAAFNAIVNALNARYPAAIREAAIHALEDLEDPRAIPHLQRLLTDSDPEIREAASEAIDWLKD